MLGPALQSVLITGDHSNWERRVRRVPVVVT